MLVVGPEEPATVEVMEELALMVVAALVVTLEMVVTGFNAALSRLMELEAVVLVVGLILAEEGLAFLGKEPAELTRGALVLAEAVVQMLRLALVAIMVVVVVEQVRIMLVAQSASSGPETQEHSHQHA